jgi:hypothetical protein
MENGLEPAGMVRLSNLALEVAYFVQAKSQTGTPFYLIKESMTVIKEPFEIVERSVLALLKESMLLRQALRAAVTGMVRGARYRNIWNLTNLFDYLRKGPPSDQLSLKQLRGKLAFLLMTLVPCRVVGIWKMEVEAERWAEDGNSVEVPTKEKTNHGRQGTVLVIRRCEVENWCPPTCYKLARARAARDGVPNMLWYTEQGKPYK